MSLVHAPLSVAATRHGLCPSELVIYRGGHTVASVTAKRTVCTTYPRVVGQALRLSRLTEYHISHTEM